MWDLLESYFQYTLVEHRRVLHTLLNPLPEGPILRANTGGLAACCENNTLHSRWETWQYLLAARVKHTDHTVSHRALFQASLLRSSIHTHLYYKALLITISTTRLYSYPSLLQGSTHTHWMSPLCAISLHHHVFFPLFPIPISHLAPSLPAGSTVVRRYC